MDRESRTLLGRLVPGALNAGLVVFLRETLGLKAEEFTRTAKPARSESRPFLQHIPTNPEFPHKEG